MDWIDPAEYKDKWRAVVNSVMNLRALLTFWRRNYFFNFSTLYTGCPRRNVPDFGRVFLRSNYTDITQNTYVQS